MKERLAEWFRIIVLGILISFGIAILFFDSLFGLPAGILAAFFFARKELKRCRKKKQKNLLNGFRSLITAMDAALSGGYSLENAFLSAAEDMERLYPADSLLNRELTGVKQKAALRIPLHTLLYEVGERNGIEEIRDFALVIETIQKMGGNTRKIIQKTVQNISMKIDTNQEIQVMVAAKQMEKQVMTVMPALILLYLRITNGNYLESLYNNLSGHLFMTVCLFVMIAADWIGEKIIRIEV